MPCRWSARRHCGAAADEIETTIDGVKMQSWRSVRRYHLRMLRKQTKTIVLLMALLEAVRIGPMQLVFAGRHGYPEKGVEDFGIAYSVGYFLCWLYVCLFAIVWVPVFSWWVPSTTSDSDSEKPGKVERVADYLKFLDMYLLPMTIGLCLVQHAYYVLSTLVYVDARPVADSTSLPKNTRKNWIARLMLLAGVAISVSSGYYMFQILADMDLAHVRHVEYLVIVVPVQVNFGLLMGSAMQWKMEARIARKEQLVVKAREEPAVASDEKQALLDV